MENSEDVSTFATNEVVKVSKKHHIPNDLSFSILSKLPHKSVKRFGSIRKTWALLFENPNFVSMYSKNFLCNDCSYNDGTSILLHQFDDDHIDGKYLLDSLSGERFENIVQLDWPDPFLNYDYGFDICGSSSINGILCLECRFQEDILLWNIGTKEFEVIPYSPVDSVPYCEIEIFERLFGYDLVRDDYKVIRHIELSPEDNYDIHGMPWEEGTDGHRIGYDFIKDDYKVTRHLEVISEVFYADGVPCGVLIKEEYVTYDSLWEIYSLRSNSWRRLDVNLPFFTDNLQVYLNGMCHWLGNNAELNEIYLVSFDLGNEVFFTTPIPSIMYDVSVLRSNIARLMVLNESIALILKDTETATFQIFILGDLGIKESWTRIFIVCQLPCIWYPLGAGKRGDIFFKKKDGGIVWLDLRTQMIEELTVITGKNYIQIVTYKENPHLVKKKKRKSSAIRRNE